MLRVRTLNKFLRPYYGKGSVTMEVFNRIEMPMIDYGVKPINDFIMTSLVRVQQIQMNNDEYTNKTPFICMSHDNNPYGYWSILETLKDHINYFMKPVDILAFGNNYNNIEYKYLITRFWLNHYYEDCNKLKLLILMERQSKKPENYLILNSPCWYPNKQFLTDIHEETKITQVINPQHGYYSIGLP